MFLQLIAKSPLGLRVTDYEEQIGADVIEHGLAGTNIARYLVEKPLSTKYVYFTFRYSVECFFVNIVN